MVDGAFAVIVNASFLILMTLPLDSVILIPSLIHGDHMAVYRFHNGDHLLAVRILELDGVALVRVLMILRVGGSCTPPSSVPSASFGLGSSLSPPGLLQKVPTQIGNSRSPSSNSTHTPAPTSGMNSMP